MPLASLLFHGGGASRRQCQSVVSEELAASGHHNESSGSLSSNVPILVHTHNSRLGSPRFASFAELNILLPYSMTFVHRPQKSFENVWGNKRVIDSFSCLFICCGNEQSVTKIKKVKFIFYVWFFERVHSLHRPIRYRSLIVFD